jgi:hypothetical protein
MTRAEADYEARVWGANIGPARVMPVTAELARAVRVYDQAVLAAALAGEGPGGVIVTARERESSDR